MTETTGFWVDRGILEAILLAHQRVSIGACGCGWDKLGASHVEHVADIIEAASRAGR